MEEEGLGFIEWMVKGVDGQPPGWHNLKPGWPIHLGVGIGLGLLCGPNICEGASKAMLPLIGALVGLTFAWAGNANALVQTPEFQKIRRTAKIPIQEYMNYYQLAIILLVAVSILWTVVGFGPFGPSKHSDWINRFASMPLFACTSLAIGEAIGVVNFARYKLIAREIFADRVEESKGPSKN
ncbi:MAG: hypothetical protein EON58_01105 [Alphaproteobacteria bacterium]|nr:MAG: hypothetical protein EON58_01105 [Alphaproteobacteria bacterium]